MCKYSAGTDTNPIFLFNMVSIECAHPPEASIVDPEIGHAHEDLLSRADASMKLTDSHASVSRRTKLAQEFVAASQELIEFCEKVIHDQHLQHQGWMAVVANVEDTATELLKKNSRLKASFKSYLSRR